MRLKSSLLRPLVVTVALCLSAFAHDLQTKTFQVDGLVVLEVSFEGTEKASFVSIEVIGPTDGSPKGDAFQTGRTDAEGRFVFMPNRDGEWLIMIDDEMGHKAAEVVKINSSASGTSSAPDATGAAAPTGRSTTDRIIIGLSVIFGLTGLLAAYTSRRKTAS